MRLTTSGIPSDSLRESLVGVISREPLSSDQRQNRVLLVDELPSNESDLDGYTAILTGAKGTIQANIPAILSPS